MEDNTENDVKLTEDEIWDVIEYARGMASMYGGSYLNPELVSARMRDINLNPMAATQDMLDRAMLDPKSYEKQLQSFSQSFELSSMVYKRLMSYLGNMLSFDLTYTSNAKPEDYKTPKYKKDLEATETFLDRFDYKKEFRTVIREMLRNDAYFACIRDVGKNIILQELPPDYCKITGKWENGFLFSFNMYWFLLPGVDIDMYPPFFKKKCNEIWGGASNKKGYDPNLPPELRANSSWIYWVDVPVTVGVCFKLSPELATRLPYFTPLFNDLILQSMMRNLQKNINMSAASKMIIGEVPMLNRDAKATVRDSLAVSPDLLSKFMALVKSAIADSIKIASAPLTNIQGISFDSDNSMYDSYLRTALASSGINTNLIFSSSVKPNAIETQLSLNVDEQMMTLLYEQFNDFMNYSIRKFTKTFVFTIEFEGTEFVLNRDKRLENAMTLFNQGIILPQKIAAAMGMKPSVFRRQMEESKANEFMDMLIPPSVQQQKMLLKINPALGQVASNVPGQSTPAKPKGTPTAEVDKGRPKKKDSEISEEGLKTRETAANVGRGGKV